MAETKDVDNRSESDLPGTTDHIPSLKITISDYSADSGREEASASESSDEKALSCPSKRKAHANIPPTKKIIRLDFSNISPVSPRALQISKTSTVDRKGLQKLAVEKAIRGGRRQGRRKYTEPEIPKIELSESNRFLEARSAMSKWASSPSILNAGDLEWAADSNNDPNALGDTISRFIMESNEEIKPPPLLINRRSGLEGSSESLPLKEPSFSDSKPLSPLRLSQRGGLLRGRSHGSQLLPVITETIYDTYNEILDLKKPENNNFVPVIKDFSQKYFAKFTENFTKAIFRPILKSHKSIVKVVEPLKLLISMIRNDDELLQNFFLSTYHIYMDDETMFKLVSSIIHFIRENFPHANTWPKIFLTFIVEWIGTYCTSHDAILEMFAEMKEILNEPSISGAIRKGSKDYEDLVEQIALRERHPFKSINFPKNMAELHQSIFSIGSLELALSLHTYMINVIWCSVKKGDPTDLIVKSLQPSNSGSEESVFLNINTFSKSLAGWIAKVILNEVSPDRRAVILEYFINTAWNALTEFNNFELVFAIILGIRAAEKQCLENSSSFFNDELSDGSTEQFMDFRRFQFPDTKQRYEKLNWLVRKDHYFVNYRRTFVKCQEGVIPFFGKKSTSSV